jgi:hypothetical protein
MRRLVAPVAAATLLVLATASSALAGKPDIFRDRFSGSEYDDFTSSVCGFDVWLTYRVDNTFIAMDGGGYTLLVHAERFRTGPGGSIQQVVNYTFQSPDGNVIVSGDPDSGSFVEVTREILTGSRVWSSPGAGVIYRDAGYYDATITITVTPDSETVEISDEVAHGQMPGVPGDELLGLLCEALG